MPRQKRKILHTNEEISTKDPPPTGEPAMTSSLYQSPLIPDHILRFLNALPITGDIMEWTRSFRESLQWILEDVDRVVVNVDVQCDLSDPERGKVHLDYLPSTSPARRRIRGMGAYAWSEGKTPSELLLEDFQRLGYPLGEYHPPKSYDYYYIGKAYLGTIFLLRDRTKKPISRRTLLAMKRLEPFLIFALSDLVARYSYAKPIDRAFQKALHELARDTKLTRRELQVLTLHLFGRRYEEIARQLYISIDTVKKHVKKIHRKTGARSSTELFAKYFTPLIDLDTLDEPIEL